MAREHGDLRVEFELYYCLMQVGERRMTVFQTLDPTPAVFLPGLEINAHLAPDRRTIPATLGQLPSWKE